MSLYHNPNMVTNGLVLCLDAGNTKSYPNTGTTWTDLSGNSNTGTLTNGPTFNSYEARTNGNLYSNDVTNAYYTQYFVTVGASSETAPNGTTTASYFTLSATATTYKGVTGGYISYPTSSIVTISCFVKPTGGARYFWIREGGYGASRVGFDLTSVSVFSSSSATGYINAAGNGWYRVQAVMGALPQSSARVQLLGASDTTPPGNSNVSSTGTETYHIWGAQCELGEFATSPMLTTSSTVTRAAGPATLVFDGVNDVVRVPYSSTYISSGSHTVEVWAKVGSIGASTVLFVINRNNSDYLQTFAIAIDNRQVVREWNPTGADQMVLTYQTGTTSNYAGTFSKNKFGTTNGDNAWHYVAGVLNNSTKNMYLFYDGVQVHTTSFTGTVAAPTCDMRIGGEYTINTAESQLLGNVARVAIYNRALSSSEIAQNYQSVRGRFGV